MKKNLVLLCIVAVSLTSCGGGYEECPEITDGYVTTFILPSPTLLSAPDKEYLEELRNEYNESIANE